MAKDWHDPDDAPDLSAAKWQKKLATTAVKRGRPRLANPKISTTIRLDADVLAKFQARGPRWQSRINAALREWLAKKAG
ncbi:BrnA antitoxin family protein [Aestuariivirga sp.]|uniref:BrnA antitoxin family protein n=1 Tax=Aestuariivirga sp. TaxID=2650926 RepID=UPI0039E5D42A